MKLSMLPLSSNADTGRPFTKTLWIAFLRDAGALDLLALNCTLFKLLCSVPFLLSDGDGKLLSARVGEAVESNHCQEQEQNQ